MFGQEYQGVNVFPVSAHDVIANLGIALLCGLVLNIVYRLVYRGPNYSVSFVNSLVILAVISAVVMLVIGNNVARAFGMIGALSIIRFRTAIRDAMDLMFIFLSLAIGMAAGVGMSWVAVIATVVACLLIMALTFTHFSEPRRRHHVLQVTYNSHQHEETQLAEILSRFCRSAKLISLKNVGSNGEFEANYHLTLRKLEQTALFIKEINALPSVIYANLYFDEDDLNAPTV